MFLALAHMVGATQVMGLWWGGVGMITFLELANMVDATQEVGSWVYYYFTFFLRYYLYDFISALRMLSSR